MTDGWTYGFLATERPVDEFGFKSDCDVDHLKLLGRPGVLFLPGLGNVATPSMAAKYAAMYSADTPDTGEHSAEGKVLLLMIAPPGHKAISEKQNSDCPTLLGGSEAFCTVAMGPGDPDYDGKWHTSLGLLGNVAPGEYSDDEITAAIGKSLLGGFVGETNPKPDRHILWWYAESAMKGIGLFQHFFADETNPWTNGELFVGGFSMGGIASLISNEADPGSRITGTFTFASHVGFEDNFRTRGDNLALRLLTADGVWAPPPAQEPFIAWDCDRFSDNDYVESLEDLYPGAAVDRMEASCRIARYFGPLHYDPTFPTTRPILLTQGSQDEPFAVRGLERTWRYLDDYLDAGLAKMHLAPDVDHKYFIGMGGVDNAFARLDYFLNVLRPSENIYENEGLGIFQYPNFDELVTGGRYEAFLNGDWINPSGRFDNLDDAETLGMNRAQTTIRHFILSNSTFSAEPDERELTPVPHTPVSPLTLEPGVLVKRSVHRYDEPMGPSHDVHEYEMIACFDPEETSGDAEIYFHTSPDRFWHAMPACLGES